MSEEEKNSKEEKLPETPVTLESFLQKLSNFSSDEMISEIFKDLLSGEELIQKEDAIERQSKKSDAARNILMWSSLDQLIYLADLGDIACQEYLMAFLAGAKFLINTAPSNLKKKK